MIPDILVLSKALGGGVLPLAAVVASGHLNVGGKWAWGHYTHKKNPVLCAAGLATLDTKEAEGLVNHATRLGNRMTDRLDRMAAEDSSIAPARGRGLLQGLELVTDPHA